MNNKLKIKDFLLISLLTAIYILIYFVSMTVVTPLGVFGHGISPGVQGLLAGSVIYFMSRKVGKMFQFTIMTLLIMGIFALMGGGYLPWLISSTVAAIVADIISSRTNNPSIFGLAISFGIMQVGQAFGQIIPALLFAEKFKNDWIKRGQSPEDMEKTLKYATGHWAIISTITIFILAFIGIYIAHRMLKKHFKEN